MILPHSFDNTFDLRSSLFRILAAGGILVSLAAGAVNMILGLPIVSTLFCWGSACLAFFLLVYAHKSGRYRLSMTLTIIMVFFPVFSVLFLNGGGYHSGMPLYFVMAAVFTAFMLEGRKMLIMVLLELAWYTCLCIFAYRHPDAVNAFKDEWKLLTDIIISLTIVSSALAAVMSLQLNLNRKKQAELDQARMEALSLNETKTSFLASMSHDIRTPLNTIVAMNELIADRTVSDEIRGFTDSIRISCDTLLSLIGDILDLSRIESRHVRLSEMPYLTAQLLKETEIMWGSAASRAGLSFRLEADETLPSVMVGDPDSIRKIINNLAGNAVKYTDSGEVVLRFRCGAPENGSIPETRVLLRIEVQDTGIGIAPEDLERIFLPFERGGRRSIRGSEGTGLGLGIVKELVDAMHGTVSCESLPGKGSLFTVCISQTVQDPGPIGPRELWRTVSPKSETFSSILAPGAKVLVVDDNEFNRQVMCTLLKPTLIQADDVDSGQEALEMLEIRKYDLIFMDIMMPGMDGLETLRNIKATGVAEGTPVIALTADALTGTRERLLDAGFSEYLAKPVSMKQLGDLLVKYLGDKVRLIRDPSFKKLPDERRNPLQEKLLPMHIRLEDALELDGGAVDTLRMRTEYFLNYREAVENISPGPEGNEALFHFVHSLKSSAKSIGAMDLAELAAYMERHREDGRLLELMIPVLQEEYRIVSSGEELLLKELG